MEEALYLLGDFFFLIEGGVVCRNKLFFGNDETTFTTVIQLLAFGVSEPGFRSQSSH